jgi:hypothetical protein
MFPDFRLAFFQSVKLVYSPLVSFGNISIEKLFLFIENILISIHCCGLNWLYKCEKPAIELLLVFRYFSF